MVYKDGENADMILSCLPPYELSKPPFCLPENIKHHTWIPCEDVGYMEFNVDDNYINEWREEIPNLTEPTVEHIQIALDWGRELYNLSLKQDVHAIIHCHLGVSRSPAFLYCIFCDWLGKGKENEAFQKVMKINPMAFPNPYIIQMADKYMDRNGNMIQELKKLQY